jgi:hypothetical protein
MACQKCKKKKPVTELPPIEELSPIPTEKEIVEAYHELTSFSGVKEEKKQFVKDIYRFLFDSDLDLECGGCSSRQVRKFHNLLKYELKLI